MRPELIRQLIEQAPTNIGMGHLATTEQNGQFDLIAAIKELCRLTPLGFQIVIIDLRSDPDFLELNHVLVLPRFPFLPALFIPEFPIVHEPADGRDGVWRDLDEVKTSLASHLQGFKGRNDADLLALVVDQPDFSDANPLIDPGLRRSGNSLPPQPVAGQRM
jgi:hypothetical protein